MLEQAQPDVEFVGEQWPAAGNFEAGATVAAIGRRKPDGILNVTCGADQTNLVRQGNTRGLFDGRVVASFAPQAVAPQAVAPQAIAPQAVAPQAIAPLAIAPQAVAPQAIAPQAVAPLVIVAGSGGFRVAAGQHRAGVA